MINPAPALSIQTADWVYPGPGDAVPGGAVAVENGRVVGVGDAGALQASWPDAPIVHKGAAILPYPANAHTHLDLTLCPPYHGAYDGFVRHLLAHPDRRGTDGARAGLARMRWHRTGAFGDVVTSTAALDMILAETDLPGVVYWEVIAPDPGEAESRFSEIRAKVDAWRRREGRIRVGISPHAAHTVSAPLLRLIGEYSRAEGIPLQVHAAETLEEMQYFRDGKGPLQKLMRELTGKAWKRPGTTPVAWLAETGILGPQTAVVHAVHAEPSDILLLAQAGSAVIACPRSNAALGTGPFPWDRFREAGVPVALGTDSAVTAGDLSVVGELRRLWDTVSPAVLLRAACCDGYRLLGLDPPAIVPGTPLSRMVILEPLARSAEPCPPARGETGKADRKPMPERTKGPKRPKGHPGSRDC